MRPSFIRLQEVFLFCSGRLDRMFRKPMRLAIESFTFSDWTFCPTSLDLVAGHLFINTYTLSLTAPRCSLHLLRRWRRCKNNFLLVSWSLLEGPKRPNSLWCRISGRLASTGSATTTLNINGPCGSLQTTKLLFFQTRYYHSSSFVCISWKMYKCRSIPPAQFKKLRISFQPSLSVTQDSRHKLKFFLDLFPTVVNIIRAN